MSTNSSIIPLPKLYRELSGGVYSMGMYKKENNYAFIDGQNLYQSIRNSKNPWSIDFLKFRIYLKDKYSVSKAYYFMGYFDNNHKKIYTRLRDSGFTLLFKIHSSLMFSKKKGNVDSDIIFYSMKKIYKKEFFDNIVLVSGDGDYRLLVDFLIEENRFCKILFPNRKNTSSAFKNLKADFFSVLSDIDVRKKIMKTPQ